MALTISEGTKQSTMDIISEVLGVPIQYARMFSWRITRDNHPKGAFNAMLDCFVTVPDEPDKKTPLHYEFGCTLPESAIQAMTETDDRAVLYRHLEYIITYQDAQRRQTSDPEFDTEAENTALAQLAEDLGIETLFTLDPPTSESE